MKLSKARNTFLIILVLGVVLMEQEVHATEPFLVTTLAGQATGGFADGIGIAAQFNFPIDVAVDTVGNLYVADAYNNRIRKIVIATGEVTTLAGQATGGFADGIGITAQFNFPTNVAVDTMGNLYVADTQNHRIRKIVIATGLVTTLAGDGTSGFTDGLGTVAQFNWPIGVTVDTIGNLYVADASNHRIRKIVIATGTVTTLAGDGTSGFADGTGTTARFTGPDGVAVDTIGNLYITDGQNNRIRKIVIATGVVTTLAGQSIAGVVDGIGTAAQFNLPVGIALDTAGNLYVGEESNHRIRKIVIATGAVTTLAGSTPGFADGIGTAAKFGFPDGVAVDTMGNLYVADTQNNRIRKLTIPYPATTDKGTLITYTEPMVSDQAIASCGSLPNVPGQLLFTAMFTVTGLPANGDSIKITLTRPSAIPQGTRLFKCTAFNTWGELLIGDNDGDNIITYQLTDGNPNTDRDNTQNKIIIDPILGFGPTAVGGVAKYYKNINASLMSSYRIYGLLGAIIFGLVGLSMVMMVRRK